MLVQGIHVGSYWLCMYAFRGCNTTSYLYGKGKATAIMTLLNVNFPGLDDMIGEIDMDQAHLLESGWSFITAL